jgi:hypothetical protein
MQAPRVAPARAQDIEAWDGGGYDRGRHERGGPAQPGSSAPALWGQQVARGIQTTGSALGAGGGAGLALAGGAMGGLGGLMQKIAADESSSGATRGIAGALSNAMIPGAAAAAIAMMATNFRMQVAARRGELDTQMGIAGLTGSSVSYGGAAAAGYTPEEAAAAAVAYGQGAGFRGAGAPPLGLARGAASLGAMAAYRGQMAGGAGGIGEANVRRAVGLAQSSGLFGSRADEFLQAIATNTATMAAQGSKTNLPAVEDFLSRAAITPGLAGTGARQVAAMTTLTGAAAGARSQVAAPFGSMLTQALTGYAYQNASGPAEAMQLLSRLAGNPGMALEALRSMGLPADMLQAGIMAQGLDQSETFGLMGMNLAGETPKLPRARGAGASALKIAAAQREARLVGMVGAEDVKMFQTQSAIDAATMALGAGGRDVSAFIINNLSDATTSITGLVTEIATSMKTLIEAVKGL